MILIQLAARETPPHVASVIRTVLSDASLCPAMPFRGRSKGVR